MPSALDWYKEVERRGLTNQLSQEQQDWWAEVKRRGLDKQSEVPTETEVPEQKTEELKPVERIPGVDYSDGPGMVQGISQRWAQRASMGAAPYIAGATNVTARMFGSVVGSLLDLDPAQLKQLNPANYPEYYREGKEELISSNQKFGEEHPVAAGVADFFGDAGAIALTAPVGGAAGAGTKLAQLGARARMAGAPRAIAKAINIWAPRAVSGTVGFGTYGGGKGFFNEGQGVSLEKGWKGAKEGSLEGLAFTMIGGAVGAIETPILERAAKMSGFVKPFAAKAATTVAGAFAEGTAVATTANAIEKALGDRENILPSEGEVLTATGVITGFRGIGKAAEVAGKGIKALKARTSTELKEMAAEGQKQQSVDSALNSIQEITQEKRTVEKELSNIKEADARLNSIESEIESINKFLPIAEDTSRIEKLRGLKFNEEAPSAPTNAKETQAAFNNLEELVRGAAESSNYRTSRTKGSNVSDSRYIDIGQGKSKIRARLSDHDLQGGNYDVFLNIKDSDQANIQKLVDALENKQKQIVEEGRARLEIARAKKRKLDRTLGFADEETLDVRKETLSAQKSKLQKELAKEKEALQEKKDFQQEQERIDFSKTQKATEEEIKAIQAKSPNTTDREAAQAIERRNKEKMVQDFLNRPKEKLSAGEKVRRWIGGKLRAAEKVTDTYAPVEQTYKDLSRMPNGEKIKLGDTSAFTLRQRDRGGELEVRQEKLLRPLEEANKKDSMALENLDSYLENKKNEEFLPGIIEDLKVNKDLKTAREKEIKLSEAKETAAESEAKHPELKKQAQAQWDYAREGLDMLYESGRISKAKYERLKQNKHYVHTDSDFPLTQSEVDTINRQSGLSSALKHYGAFEGPRKNFIASNLVKGKQIWYFAQTEKAKKQWLKAALKTGEAKPVEMPMLAEGEFPKDLKPNQIMVWNNGIARVYEVPESVAKAFNYVRKEEGVLLKNLRITNNLFKLNTSGIANGFALTNLLADFQSVFGASRSGKYVTPSMIKTAAEIYGPGSNKLQGHLKDFKEIVDSRLGKEATLLDTQLDLDKSTLQKLNTMLEAQGKANERGTFIGDTMALVMKAISTAKSPAEKSLQKLSKGLSFLGTWSEKIGRATVFQTELRRQAGSDRRFEYWMQDPKNRIPKEALDAATKEMAEVTLDFPRKMHPTIEWLNRYTSAFFKPSMLGAERVWKVLTDPEIAPVAWRWIGTVSALQGMIRAEMNEEKKKKYNSQFNPEISAKQLSFMDSKGQIHTIKANQELGGLYQLGAAATERFLNSIKNREQREGAKNEITAAAMQFAENAVPGGYFFEPSNWAFNPVAKMVIEEKINKNLYTNTEIESKALQRLPVEERYTANTPKVYRLMSKYLKIGDIQSSPKMWEHRTRALGSSFAKEMTDVTDAILGFLEIGEDEWTTNKQLEENAIFGRFFYKDFTPYARNVQELDKEMKELEQAYYYMKKNPNSDNKEIQYKAGIYNAAKKIETKRMNLISLNQKVLQDLQQQGQKAWKQYVNGDLTKSQYEKKKEMARAHATTEFKKNQKEISAVTDELLKAIRKEKKAKGIK
jgi:hypothetical protein